MRVCGHICMCISVYLYLSVFLYLPVYTCSMIVCECFWFPCMCACRHVCMYVLACLYVLYDCQGVLLAPINPRHSLVHLDQLLVGEPGMYACVRMHMCVHVCITIDARHKLVQLDGLIVVSLTCMHVYACIFMCMCASPWLQTQA
jgi:hypothetical protein